MLRRKSLPKPEVSGDRWLEIWVETRQRKEMDLCIQGLEKVRHVKKKKGLDMQKVNTVNNQEKK